jgi:hypothetical protein
MEIFPLDRFPFGWCHRNFSLHTRERRSAKLLIVGNRCSRTQKGLSYTLARCFHRVAARSLDQLHIRFTFDLTVIEEVALNCNPSFFAIMPQRLDCWARGFADLRWRTLIAYHWVAASELKTRALACQRDPPPSKFSSHLYKI